MLGSFITTSIISKPCSFGLPSFASVAKNDAVAFQTFDDMQYVEEGLAYFKKSIPEDLNRGWSRTK